MAVKRCCVENCNSSSTRLEDIGVTYHKFPKDTTLRETWVFATHVHTNIDSCTYVCSRHFCKSDFQSYQDSKYVLKSDAVPSIFIWNKKSNTHIKMESPDEVAKEQYNISTSSKECEGENLEAIRRYIEDQEKEIQELEKEKKNEKNVEKPNEMKNKPTLEVIEQGEPMVIATSVIDMILSESEAKIANAHMKNLPKQHLSPRDKASTSSSSNSMALTVGSKVEAKDFSEFWYAAEIVEVDYDEMEVLVHYENVYNKHDEWISVNSPRLRPYTRTSRPITPQPQSQPQPSTPEVTEMKEDKQEEKNKVKFVVGERCLARWRDNRRFVATINNDLGNGHYEIIFDDGFQWKCTASRLYKLKDSKQELTVDISMSPTPSSPSPVLEAGPSTNVNPLPVYHTHLFDPTRDYLGSKSERREMKRKLNIKEIFNIGQKKQKKRDISMDKEKAGDQKKVLKKKVKTEVKSEIKTEIPDAVASIIGTVAKEVDSPQTPEIEQEDEEKEISPIKEENKETDEIVNKEHEEMEVAETIINENTKSVQENADLLEPSDLGIEVDNEPVVEEEMKLEQFEKPDESKKEVIEKMKEVITKLEDGLHQMEKVNSPKPELIIKLEPIKCSPIKEDVTTEVEKKKVTKVKKNKKLRLLQEKKVKKQVDKVKSELAEMKKQMEEMRKEMLLKTEELSMGRSKEMPESFLLPGEWCCKWVDGQPVGTVTDIEIDTKDGSQVMLRRNVQVEDKRLPPGWTKLMVRRSMGQSAGKWDVALIGPDNRRFHTKTDMRNFLEQNKDDSLKPYETALLDFGVHLKLSRRMGWVVGGKPPSSKRRDRKERKEKKKKKKKLVNQLSLSETPGPSQVYMDPIDTFADMPNESPTLEDGYVYVGSLKVQIIENLLRCPAEGCFKNFRNNTLIQMHIKHYHRELREMLGATPKVLDLAQERTKPTDLEPKPRYEPESKIIKVKIPRPPKRVEEPKPEPKEPVAELQIDTVAPKTEPRPQDSPKLRHALVNKPVKRPKVLLPVRRLNPEMQEPVEEPMNMEIAMEAEIEKEIPMDFELEIAPHTVVKPSDDKKKVVGDKKRKCLTTGAQKPLSEEDEWFTMNSDFETRSSFPGSGTPDSKTMEKSIQPVYESNEEQKDTNMYMYTETGERVKIEHMKREEIINCHCGFREEDGLMVQCELCLCWQHAACHNILREAEVPEKYTCSICLNPRRGRRSKRFLHDQDRLYEGLLPGAKPCDPLRRSHELSGNLLRIQDALHALRVKYYVATKKDHPKLYLWAKDWENAEVTYTQERLNSDYSDLNIIINNIGKENLPVKPEEIKDAHLDVRMPLTDDTEQERLLGLNTALSSPSGASLELPISTLELERFAKTVQEQDVARPAPATALAPAPAPQPEAAIENSACRERLLRHVQRCQALIDARLDSIEAQIAELESQDPSFEDDETADYFPRTKQTIQMLMRDLDTMEELGIIT